MNDTKLYELDDDALVAYCTRRHHKRTGVQADWKLSHAIREKDGSARVELFNVNGHLDSFFLHGERLYRLEVAS